MAGDMERAGGFEAWAEAEVARLRAEADVLEAQLARYRATGDGRVSLPRPAGTRRNGALLLALEGAGPDGLALADVVAAAARAGLGASRANVRSFLWNHVRAGRVVTVGDRYVAAAHAAPADPGRTGGIPDGTAGAAGRP